MQCNSQYNAIPNTMQLQMQCNFRYNAIPDAMQFPMQCNSQGNAIQEKYLKMGKTLLGLGAFSLCEIFSYNKESCP